MRMAAEAMASMPAGQVIEVIADDPMVFLDLPDWCALHGHDVLSMEQRRDVITTHVRVA
jgi:TusA-related sulfurtransferase